MRISVLQKKHYEQTDEIRAVYEEKLKTLSDSKEMLLEEISTLKQRKTKIKYTVHYQCEIEDCSERLNALSTEERNTSVRVERMKLEGDRFRQKSAEEVGERVGSEDRDRCAAQKATGYRYRIATPFDREQQRFFLRMVG